MSCFSYVSSRVTAIITALSFGGSKICFLGKEFNFSGIECRISFHRYWKEIFISFP